MPGFLEDDFFLPVTVAGLVFWAVLVFVADLAFVLDVFPLAETDRPALAEPPLPADLVLAEGLDAPVPFFCPDRLGLVCLATSVRS